MKQIGIIAAFIASVVSNTFAGDETVAVHYNGWFPKLSGDVRADTKSVIGTNIDADVLGIEDTSFFNEIGGHVQFGVPLLSKIRINGDYWMGRFKGDENLTTAVTFVGKTFSLSTPVETTLDLEVGTVTLEPFGFSIGLLEWVKLDLGPQIGAKFVRLKGKIESSITSASENVEGPVPVLGGRVELNVAKWLTLKAEANGLDISAGDVDVSIIEGSAGAYTNLFRYVYAGGGYHVVLLEVGKNDPTVEADLDIKGVYFEVGIRF